MFKILHNKKIQKKIWFVLAIVIVPAFVLWGSGSLTRSQKEGAGAGHRMFGKTVSAEDFDNAMQAVKNTLIMQYGEDFSQIQQMLGNNLEPMAYVRLLLLREAKKRKIKVDDAAVIGFIQRIPLFETKGAFDNKAYTYMLTYVLRTQPRIFEEQMRQNLALGKLSEEITKGVTVTDKEVRDAYEKENRQISVYYIAALPADFSKGASVSEEELKDYFGAHAIDFKQPPSYNLEYALLAPDTMNEALERMNKKEDLSKIAKDLGLTVKETGLFGQADAVPGIGWSPQIAEAAGKLKMGETAGPLQADKNYYLIKLKEQKEAYVPAYEDAREKVTDVLIRQKARSLAKDKIDACLKLMQERSNANPAKPVDFDAMAKETGLKSAATGSFSDGSYIEGIGASDTFFAAAKDLKENQFSAAIAEPSGYYIVKLKSSTPIDEAKFETEKEAFAKKLLLQKKEDFFSRFVIDLEKKAKAG